MLLENDLKLIKQKGISIDAINQQIELFKKGTQYLNITQPAIISCGISKLSDSALKKAGKKFEKESRKLNMIKFVPASGAATRMFKHLYEFKKHYKESPDRVLGLLADREFNSPYYFFENLANFAFINDLATHIHKKGGSIDSFVKDKRYGRILSALLGKKGMNYGNLPKGLIKFHKYNDFSRSAVEEHLVEAANCCKCSKKRINVHFTVSEEHIKLFQQHIDNKYTRFEKIFDVKYNITLSTQDSSTNIIAVNTDNEVARDEDGNLIFRPGGHGSLIKNLNSIDADIIFIKNIDNVVTDDKKNETFVYKKALAGVLINIQKTIHNYMKKAQDKSGADKNFINKILKFIVKELNILPPKDISNWDNDKKLDYIKTKLNRPIRVCGMVENEDEPGGGPFLVENSDMSHSLQIVERNQIKLKDKKQLNILSNATHFNPVDIVCSTKDYNGDKFDLTKFVDYNSCLISEKSYGDQKIKALEHPGLWNGGMSDWITIFIEVPIITFNPVKIINDLLREEHLILAKKH